MKKNVNAVGLRSTGRIIYTWQFGSVCLTKNRKLSQHLSRSRAKTKRFFEQKGKVYRFIHEDDVKL